MLALCILTYDSRLATAMLAVALATGCSVSHASQKDEFNTWLSSGATPYMAGISGAERQVAFAQSGDDPAAILSSCQEYAGAVSAAAAYAQTNPPRMTSSPPCTTR